MSEDLTPEQWLSGADEVVLVDQPIEHADRAFEALVEAASARLRAEQAGRAEATAIESEASDPETAASIANDVPPHQ